MVVLMELMIYSSSSDQYERNTFHCRIDHKSHEDMQQIKMFNSTRVLAARALKMPSFGFMKCNPSTMSNSICHGRP